MRAVAWTIAAALLTHSLPARAQMLRVTFEAHAHMGTSSGALSSCGLIFRGAHVDDVVANGVNGSIVLQMAGSAGIKAGLFEITTARGGGVQRTPSPYRFAWARVDGLAFTAPQKPEHIIPSDDEGYILLAMPLAEGAELLINAATGHRLWLGFKTKQGWERVLSGPIKWDAGAEEQFRECLSQMSEAAAQGAKVRGR